MASEAPALSVDLIAEHGISPDEYERLLKELGREPTLTELGVFSVMWSEHCSYKSSRVWLKKLPTTGPQVIQGPGENAGVVSLGDGQAAVFKMESHNHPSYIEPYQGAATGVGGIMRDVFTMGARPIANMNALRFGSPGHPRPRHLVAGVVSGIGDYGNCMGVPTIGGETNFDPRYNDNILVNAMCVGLVDADRIFKSAAKGVGLPVVYVGSKTGRDGIHGATMASAEFDEASEEKRPTVQVGDPFTEKLLLEACLELMTEDVIIAIQDMGAAGLTSSSVEMADKGGVGIDLDLDKVPMREEGMTAYEMLLSESQERMLMVLKPGSEPVAERIFTKWELDFAVIGKTTDTGHFVARHNGVVEADIPLPALAHAAPIYERPFEKRETLPTIAPEDVKAPPSILSALERLLGSPHLSSRRWIYEQYDHMVMGDTVQRPGGDAGAVRVHGTDKGLAVSCDVTPRYCAADPFEGGKQAVAECWRNLTATGAKPLAITDCLNFGNPERPEIMGEFVGAIEGMAEACTALHFPVVSGNVSLYNETNGVAIPPTPAVGGVGLIADIAEMADMALKADGDVILLLGSETGHLGQSIYMSVMEDRLDGAPPPVDLARERSVGDLIRGFIKAGTVDAVHDVSDGGLLVAIAEMALAGKRGVDLEAAPDELPAHAVWFGEDQARYVVTTTPDKVDTIVDVAAVYDVPVRVLGTVGGDTFTLSGEAPLPLGMLRAAHEDWLPRFMTRR
ncbi:phosphoribosylformylglycinamidine synthase [Methyloceanibacter methanicus]|uniref:Phosphoribosylformylglycinamidine synthase subunit PurL n=1 Tax=Methyloceanibacter methanicus TaxID=1774968 RepID=A0A1E3VZ45_9HYPH|nr:phosphoribosylformylglycinamidine synthase subunit PurL [Methyloceanibacter methanicus]ODR98835.1 phosphoribosylformylglycinamidine synthase [Methyloceanibacter methanicus]